MSLQNELDLVFSQAAATQTFWNVYLVVATAILALLSAVKSEYLTVWSKTALTVVFLLFAFSNRFGGLKSYFALRVSLQKVAVFAHFIRQSNCS